VASLEIKGKPVHEARLAAVMPTHGVAQLLTFKRADCPRFSGIGRVHADDIPLDSNQPSSA
jgi:hypothetical protein